MNSLVAHDKSLELVVAHKGTVTRSRTSHNTVIVKKGVLHIDKQPRGTCLVEARSCVECRFGERISSKILALLLMPRPSVQSESLGRSME